MLNKLIGKLFFYWVKNYVRLKAKCYSSLIGGAFWGFGKKSILAPPIRLKGAGRIKIGDNVFIGPNSWLQVLPDGDNSSPAIIIGDNSSLAGFSVISAVRQVVIEEKVLIARNLYVADHSHNYTNRGVAICEQGIDKIKPVLIRHGSWIGQNVVVCPGVTIGIGSVIGANSLVNKDIPDYSVAAGSPARIIKLSFDK